MVTLRKIGENMLRLAKNVIEIIGLYDKSVLILETFSFM